MKDTCKMPRNPHFTESCFKHEWISFHFKWMDLLKKCNYSTLTAVLLCTAEVILIVGVWIGRRTCITANRSLPLALEDISLVEMSQRFINCYPTIKVIITRGYGRLVSLLHAPDKRFFTLIKNLKGNMTELKKQKVLGKLHSRVMTAPFCRT